jgi:hypothetical protein
MHVPPLIATATDTPGSPRSPGQIPSMDSPGVFSKGDVYLRRSPSIWSEASSMNIGYPDLQECRFVTVNYLGEALETLSNLRGLPHRGVH